MNTFIDHIQEYNTKIDTMLTQVEQNDSNLKNVRLILFSSFFLIFSHFFSFSLSHFFLLLIFSLFFLKKIVGLFRDRSKRQECAKKISESNKKKHNSHLSQSLRHQVGQTRRLHFIFHSKFNHHFNHH